MDERRLGRVQSKQNGILHHLKRGFLQVEMTGGVLIILIRMGILWLVITQVPRYNHKDVGHSRADR